MADLALSCFVILSVYHDLSLVLRLSLIGLFTLKSKVCSLSVQLYNDSGTYTMMCFAVSKS